MLYVNIYYENKFLLRRLNLIRLITEIIIIIMYVLFVAKRFYQILITGFSHILTCDITHWEVLNGNKLTEAVNNVVDNAAR